MSKKTSLTIEVKTTLNTNSKLIQKQGTESDVNEQELLNPLAKFALGLNNSIQPLLETATNVTETSAAEILNVTTNTVNNEKPSPPSKDRFKCSKCSRSFKTRSHYDYHIKVHNDIKAFGCEVCGKRFITKQAMQKHGFVHNRGNLGNFVCSICNKQFQTKQNLFNHLNTHNKNKPYKCEKCQKFFAEKSTLSKHLTTHSKVRKYSCCLCNKTFTQAGSKQKHIKKFHSLNVSEYGGFLPALGAEVVANELQYLESTFMT
uniref:Gastrula zinc finger protein XlCGF71.1-like n=1 Tax=Phallusia mammillata TaxID=59560 RepID=A0A6F9DY11_9ASCI|nr:gastrula zinc finger protein XlCGF71.1-like [Phallusia mammillata]